MNKSTGYVFLAAAIVLIVACLIAGSYYGYLLVQQSVFVKVQLAQRVSSLSQALAECRAPTAPAKAAPAKE